jgi:hypothetical protein
MRDIVREALALMAVLVFASLPHLAFAQPAPPPNPEQPAYN